MAIIIMCNLGFILSKICTSFSYFWTTSSLFVQPAKCWRLGETVIDMNTIVLLIYFIIYG